MKILTNLKKPASVVNNKSMDHGTDGRNTAHSRKLHLVVTCGGSLVLGLVLMHLRITVRWEVRVREARVRVSRVLMHLLLLREDGLMHLRIMLRG